MLSVLLQAEICYRIKIPCVVFDFADGKKMRLISVGLLRLFVSL